jgi:hypothetical protein
MPKAGKFFTYHSRSTCLKSCYCILATCIAFFSFLFCISEQASRGVLDHVFLRAHGSIFWHLPTEKFSILCCGLLFLFLFNLLYDACSSVSCINRRLSSLSARLLSKDARVADGGTAETKYRCTMYT